MLPGKAKIDISSFSAAERELFEKYGKVPTHKTLLSNKLKERKYFDSGDYALSKAGHSAHQTVGTAIPSPSDIPHSTPSLGMSTSPTNNILATSPAKDTSLANHGTARKDNLTFNSPTTST